MAITRYGANLQTGLVEAGKPVYSEDDRGRAQVQYFYHCLASAVLSLLPAYNSPAPDAMYSGLLRREVTVTETAPGTVAVTVTYREPGGSTPPAVGDVTLESQTTVTEVPVEQISGITEAEILAAKAKGVHTVLRFPVTVTRTEIVSSFTFSEANLISGVGARSAPTGVTSPTSDAWLKTGRVVRVGDVISVQDTWAYDANLWQNVDGSSAFVTTTT